MVPAVLDHLWQSTLVALAAALLVLSLRKAPAGVRYGLWFTASAKFLIPFAGLAGLGRLLAPAGLAPAGAAPEAVRIEQAARPLAQFPFAHPGLLQAPLSSSPPLAPAPAVHAPAALGHFDPASILLAVWLLGSAGILMAGAVRWARVRRVARSARSIDWPAPMPVRASSSLMEPGLVGFWRPVLIVPETLAERLARPEIEAILAHEACHLRRRDNLTAASHMLVEALFWFHPLVWWIGARLIEERERACDEAVVAAGHDRAAYARALVESCRLYLQSPLSCVAGASGSTLKTRVEAIMTAPPSSPLSPLKKAVLLAAGAGAFATPVAAGLLTSPEGRAAAIRSAAVASTAPEAPAVSAAPAEGRAEKPLVLARREPVLPPALAVARLDAAPAATLSQDPAVPAGDQAARGTEESVRRWITALQTHQPDFDDMTPAVEQSARQQWAMATQMFRGFGTLKDLRFLRVTPEGDDAYEADFAHGRIQVMVGPLTPDGKLARLAWGPLWAQGASPGPGRPLPPAGGMQAPLYRWGSPASDVAPPPSAQAPVTREAEPADAKAQALSFVQSYAAATPQRRLIARWIRPLCLRVVGLTPDQAIAVRARVEEVARSVGAPVGSECRRDNVQIGFSPEPQRMLDEVIRRQNALLGDRTSDTRSMKTVTRPIQAWYLTNGVEFVDAEAGGLKALARYQLDPGAIQQYFLNNGSAIGGGRYAPPPDNPRFPPSPPPSYSPWRQFLNVFVLVDLRRTGGSKLGLIADNVAMLVLSQPRSPDRCNVLPSVTDLFADPCSGRAAPDGLTRSDAAYLTALYAPAPQGYVAGDQLAVARNMAAMLDNPKIAAR